MKKFFAFCIFAFLIVCMCVPPVLGAEELGVNDVPKEREYGYSFNSEWKFGDCSNLTDFPYISFSGKLEDENHTTYFNDYKVFGVNKNDYICVGYHYKYSGLNKITVLLYDKDTKKYISAVNVYQQYDVLNRIYNDDTPNEHEETAGGTLLQYCNEITFQKCNIPVFDTRENCDNYVNNGSFDGILNDSYLPYEFDLECPLDLKCELLNRTAGYERFSFTWSQKDKNYINWDTEFLFYCDLRYRKQIFGFIGVSDWVNVDDFFIFDKYCSTSNLKYSTELYCSEYDDALDHYFSSINEDLGGKQIQILGADFYVRNKYVDAASGKVHYSNWVRVHYTSNGDNIEVSYSEIEVDNPDSVGSNGKPAGTLNPDNGYTGEVQQATVNSASGLVDFVKNGFGLLGNNGLISFLKQTLAFVPVEFWEIIIIGVSFFVLIAIIKFARG